MTAESILNEAKSLETYLCDTRRALHERAETGFDLTETLAYVKARLAAMGIAHSDCGKAGILATLGKAEGKCILLRADMDALPIPEETGEAFAAKNGACHACGHDMHTAMLLGAARILKNHEAELRGTVKLMFQPAEELLEGAKDMIDAGVLDSPRPDGAMMLHVMAALPHPTGTVIVSAPGVGAPAADYFEIKVRGRGCHGSMPDTGVDPLNAAAHILIALQEINAREMPMGERMALTIGTLNAGAAPNVIPDMVTMGGTLRAFDENVREFIKQRVTDISAGIASAFRAEAELAFTRGCPSLYNDESMVLAAESYAKELLGDKVISAGGSGGGSEDFAYVSREVPSVMLALTAGSPDEGYVYPQHHPKVRFDEGVLPIGSAVYAYTALRWLEDNA